MGDAVAWVLAECPQRRLAEVPQQSRMTTLAADLVELSQARPARAEAGAGPCTCMYWRVVTTGRAPSGQTWLSSDAPWHEVAVSRGNPFRHSNTFGGAALSNTQAKAPGTEGLWLPTMALSGACRRT